MTKLAAVLLVVEAAVVTWGHVVAGPANGGTP